MRLTSDPEGTALPIGPIWASRLRRIGIPQWGHHASLRSPRCTMYRPTADKNALHREASNRDRVPTNLGDRESIRWRESMSRMAAERFPSFARLSVPDIGCRRYREPTKGRELGTSNRFGRYPYGVWGLARVNANALHRESIRWRPEGIHARIGYRQTLALHRDHLAMHPPEARTAVPTGPHRGLSREADLTHCIALVAP